MKKNIIISALAISTTLFASMAYIQKSQNEKLEIQVQGAKDEANMYRAEAQQAKEMALMARDRALEHLKQAESAAVMAEQEARVQTEPINQDNN